MFKYPRMSIQYEIKNMTEFQDLLNTNPGCIFIKFGAEWCVPCNKIKEYVLERFEEISSDTVKCIVIDVDESFEVYAHLKNKRMINGIPAILKYCQGNTSFIPDKICSGTNRTEIANILHI